MSIFTLADQATAPDAPAAGEIRVFSVNKKLASRADTGLVTVYTGDVSGPGVAVDNAIALFNGTTGKVIKESTVTNTQLQTLTDGSNADSLHTHTQVGEANTASNQGADGVSVFKQKTGVDLEFKSISSSSSKISVVNDVPNNEIDLDVVEANLVHDNISGSGSNTHSQIDGHLASVSNPHAVSFTQAVASDGGTDISAAEAETLTDGSNADALHTHVTPLPFFASAVSAGNTASTLATPTEKLKLTTSSLPSGDYKVEWYVEINSADTGEMCETIVELDDTTTLSDADSNPDTAGGTGYGTMSGFAVLTAISGVHFIDIDFSSSTAGKTVNVRNARLAITQVG